jgi:hypothetical protein
MAMNNNYTFLPNPKKCQECHREDGWHTDICKSSKVACPYCFSNDSNHSAMCMRAPGACKCCYHSDGAHSARCDIEPMTYHEKYSEGCSVRNTVPITCDNPPKHICRITGEPLSKHMYHITGVNPPKHICRITGEPLSKHMYHITGVLLPTRW